MRFTSGRLFASLLVWMRLTTTKAQPSFTKAHWRQMSLGSLGAGAVSRKGLRPTRWVRGGRHIL